MNGYLVAVKNSSVGILCLEDVVSDSRSFDLEIFQRENAERGKK